MGRSWALLWILNCLVFVAPLAAAERPPLERLPKAKDPVQLDKPLVITRSGLTRLDRNYRARGAAIVIAAPNVILDGGGHVVEFNTDGNADVRGVHVYVDGSWAEADKPLGVIAGGSAGKGATIRNLYVRQAVLNSPRNAGIGGQEAFGVVIERCLVEAGGEDSSSIHFPWGELSVSSSVLLDHQDQTANRHSGPANIICPKVRATSNFLWGGNSGINCREPGSIITGNVIAHNSFATNGYGAWLYQPSEVTVAHNVILPSNGRGILLSGGAEDHKRGHRNVFESNVILAWDHENDEFGESLNACGIRVRYWAHDLRVRNNTMLSVGGKPYCGASGLYLSSGEPSATGTLSGNTAYSVLLGPPDRNHYAEAITFEGHRDCDYLISDNRFFSNHLLLRLAGYDGSGQQDRPLVGNEFSWSTGGQSVSAFRAAVDAKLVAIGMADNPWSKWWLGEVDRQLAPVREAELSPQRKTLFSAYDEGDEHITLLDNRGDATFSLDDIHLDGVHHPGRRWIALGRQARVQAVRGGKPLARTKLLVAAEQDFTCQVTTDEQGYFELPVIECLLGRRGAAAGEPYTRRDNRRMSVSLESQRKEIPVDHVPQAIAF